MTMKDLVKVLDWLTEVYIWTPDCDDDEEPQYEGPLLDMPWYFLDYTVGRIDGSLDEPIYTYAKDGKSYVIINCYDAKYEKGKAEKLIKEKEKEIEKLKKLL